MKINCNDGCLDNYSGSCVKYTGTQISNPLIIQNETLNNVINIIVNRINSLPGAADTYITTSVDIGTITEASLNALYSDKPVGFSVHYTNLVGSPTLVLRFSKYDTSGKWIFFQAGKVT